MPKTEEEKLAAHRALVSRSAAARKNAINRLIKAHEAEYKALLAEEKSAQGIKTLEERRAEKQKADFLALLAANPHLSDLVIEQMAREQEKAA